ncbi:exported hypothetical protein [Frankia canadensis]|uniref:Uncharacterized protein n=1 Tax=Frankia canadensis TaxID=1836972 RepID=A0A2I2KVZ9_9ACTN|nr:exported hypothetical protein [Frankia canadensis]SOU57130.1 exported hypothetical protein [Frankia canadensis]
MLTRMSTPPSRATVSSTSARTDSSTPVSVGTAWTTRPWRCATSSAARRSRSAERAARTRSTPSAASACATASPIPWLAPVTMARLSVRPRSMVPLSGQPEMVEAAWNSGVFRTAGAYARESAAQARGCFPGRPVPEQESDAPDVDAERSRPGPESPGRGRLRIWMATERNHAGFGGPAGFCRPERRLGISALGTDRSAVTHEVDIAPSGEKQRTADRPRRPPVGAAAVAPREAAVDEHRFLLLRGTRYPPPRRR